MSFIKKYYIEILLVLIILGVAAYSLFYLTTKPRLWTDEAFGIEVAKNFLLYGRLDLMMAPQVFTGSPFLAQANGYPMTMALAGFFKIFGFGLIQARMFTLFLMIACLLVVFWFTKKLFNKKYAVLAVLLVVSLPAFYASGRCVTGEITGFIFLIIGLGLFFRYFLSENGKNLIKIKDILAGLFFGLAIFSKPSVYTMVLPAVIVALLFERRQFLKRTLAMFLGIAVPALGWIMLNVPNFLTKESWIRIAEYYKNPYAPLLVSDNMRENLINLSHNFTLFHFFVLLAVVLFILFEKSDFLKQQKGLAAFFISYEILAFIYFFRSPGWLRYLVAAQLLIFVFLSPAINAIWGLLKNKVFFSRFKISPVYPIVIFLVCFQTFYLLTRADIFYSDNPQRVIQFIERYSSEKTIGIYNSITISCLMSHEKRYQMINSISGFEVLGKDFLLVEDVNQPDVIIATLNEPLIKLHEKTIQSKYEKVETIGPYVIYELKSGRTDPKKDLIK